MPVYLGSESSLFRGCSWPLQMEAEIIENKLETTILIGVI